MFSPKQQNIEAAKPGSVAARIKSLNTRVTQVQAEAAQDQLARSRPPTPPSISPRASYFPAPPVSLHHASTPVEPSHKALLKKEMPGRWPVDEKPHPVRHHLHEHISRSEASTPAPAKVVALKLSDAVSAPVSPRISYTAVSEDQAGFKHRETLSFVNPAGPRIEYPYEHHRKHARYEDMDVTSHYSFSGDPSRCRNPPGDISGAVESKDKGSAERQRTDGISGRGGKRFSESDAGIPWTRFKRPAKEDKTITAFAKTTPTSPVVPATPMAPPTTPALSNPFSKTAKTAQIASIESIPTLTIAIKSTTPGVVAPTDIVSHVPFSVADTRTTVTLTVSNVPAKLVKDPCLEAEYLTTSTSEVPAEPSLKHEEAVAKSCMPKTEDASPDAKNVLINPNILVIGDVAATAADETLPVVPGQFPPQLQPENTLHAMAAALDATMSTPNRRLPSIFGPSLPLPKIKQLETLIKNEQPTTSPLAVPTSPTASETLNPPSHLASPFPSPSPSTAATSTPHHLIDSLNAIALSHRAALTQILSQLLLQLIRLSTDYDAISLLSHMPLKEFPNPHGSIAAEVAPRLFEEADMMAQLMEVVVDWARDVWLVDLDSALELEVLEQESAKFLRRECENVGPREWWGSQRATEKRVCEGGLRGGKRAMENEVEGKVEMPRPLYWKSTEVRRGDLARESRLWGRGKGHGNGEAQGEMGIVLPVCFVEAYGGDVREYVLWKPWKPCRFDAASSVYREYMGEEDAVGNEGPCWDDWGLLDEYVCC